MIIISNKDKLLKDLAELEADLEAGNISKRDYRSLKSEYTQELETLEVADRIRRMQGRGTDDKTLDHWAAKSKAEKDAEEQEELVKKFVTTPKPSRKPVAAKTQTRPKLTIVAIIFLALAFFVGTAFGIYFLNQPADTEGAPVLVNETAFPLINNTTNMTNKTNQTLNITVNKTNVTPVVPVKNKTKPANNSNTTPPTTTP